MRHLKILGLCVVALSGGAGAASAAEKDHTNRGLQSWGDRLDFTVGRTGKQTIDIDAGVYARLRQGVIAEVGAGRPATVGMVVKPGTQLGGSYGMSFGRLRANVEVSSVTQDISGLKLPDGQIAPQITKVLALPVDGRVRMTGVTTHLIYDLPAFGRFTPYVGAGVGVGTIDLAMASASSRKSYDKYEELAGIEARVAGPVGVFVEVRSGQTSGFAFGADGVASQTKTKSKSDGVLCGITSHF